MNNIDRTVMALTVITIIALLVSPVRLIFAVIAMANGVQKTFSQINKLWRGIVYGLYGIERSNERNDI